MLTDKQRLHEPTDTNGNPTHDNYRHHQGPEPFPPGSSDYLAVHRELDRLATSEITNRSQAKTPIVPTSLHKRKERQPGTVDECPRAVRRWIEDGPRMQGVWLPCNSRTCGYCKDAVDERDVARLVHSLATDKPYVVTVPTKDWEKIRKSVQRMRKAGHDAVAVKMGTRTAHDEIAVIMSGPIVENARRIGIGEIVELVTKRPPGGKMQGGWDAVKSDLDIPIGEAMGRLSEILTVKDGDDVKLRVETEAKRPGVHLSGPGLVSVREWESEGSPGEKMKRKVAAMSRKVTVDAAEICAQVLGLRTERRGLSLTVWTKWDSPEGQALRKWSKDPDGSLDWSRIRHEIDSTTEEPPEPDELDELEPDARQLVLESV